MKKVFMILGAGLLAALLVFSCSKPNNQKPNNKPDDDNKEQQGGEQEGGEEGFSMEVNIDGDFSEWDALTADTADGEYYIYEENSDADLNSILRLKLASDADNVYVYAEINYAKVFVAEGGPFEVGNSNIGFGPEGSHPGSPGPLWVWIDGDGDASGAVSTAVTYDGAAEEEDPIWDYAGFDAPLQYYFCYDVEASKMQLGWQQVNYPIMAEDKSDWGRPFINGENWNSETDNLATGANMIGFAGPMSIKDPVTGANVDAIKIEIAIDRSAILESGDAVKGSIVIGVDYENPDDSATCMHNMLSEISGKLPSASKPATLKLK